MVRVLRPIPVERLKLLVFDLDGTLIDSAQDLCNSVNAALVYVGRERLPDPLIASYVGEGVLMLMQRALFGLDAVEVDEGLLARAHDYFLGYYREHKLDFTYSYAGVMESLAALKAIHDEKAADGTTRTMSVLTNKPVNPARAICEALGLAPFFKNIYGGNSFTVKKPDPMGLRTLMDEVGARPDETVMIGDSEVDVLTAQNAGAWSIGCTFGLAPQTLENTPPDLLVDTPEDWTAALCPAKIG